MKPVKQRPLKAIWAALCVPVVLLILLVLKAPNLGVDSSAALRQLSQLHVFNTPQERDAGLRDDYLRVVREALTGYIIRTPSATLTSLDSVTEGPFNATLRNEGKDWPMHGYSMAGNVRLQNVQQSLEAVLSEGIPGSFVECGVWRGGASIYAAAVLHAYGITDRDVHLVDSFKGLPPNTTDKDTVAWSKMKFLMIPLEKVQDHFRSFGLLGPRVHFHQGYFRYALPRWRGGDRSPIAVLRMDGDMWESTMDQFYNLWDDIAPGGFIIVDDYGVVVEARKAVHDFLDHHGYQVAIHDIDGVGAWFRKPADAKPCDRAWYEAWNATRTSADLAR